MTSKTISHCIIPSDGWALTDPDGSVVAHVPVHLEAPLECVQVLADALDRAANTKGDLSPDLPYELRAYTARTPLGWRVHNGLGLLVAHVPLDTPDAEKKVALVVRAADAMWCDMDKMKTSRAPNRNARRKAKAHAK